MLYSSRKMCFSSCSSYIIIFCIIHRLMLTVHGVNFQLDEKIGFQIRWPGKLHESDVKDTEDASGNVISIMTQEKEQYHCIIPEVRKDEPDKETEILGPNPMNLIRKLFSSVLCTIKMEQFWTYELCHGYFIRQYHKDITVDEVGKMYREYILGKLDPALKKNDEERLMKLSPLSLKKVTVNGKEYPYWGVNMTDGAVCDIHGRNRFTYVMYVCHVDGYNEMYSIKETSICEYEMIILTPMLCDHHAFRLRTPGTNDINCYALGDSPVKPSQLLSKADAQKEPFKPFMEEEENTVPREQVPSLKHKSKLVNDFLSGKYCLQGGTGWWLYEFCYGKKVLQFHEEKGVRTTVLLGKWDVVNHLLWLTENPHKKPKKGESKQISHMYTGGSFCEESGKNRRVEVRLKCKEGNSNSNSISMYLLEPKPCDYILPVESSILCSVIEASNEFGLA